MDICRQPAKRTASTCVFMIKENPTAAVAAAVLAIAERSSDQSPSLYAERARTSRGLDPSAGPMIPSFSIISIIRAARL